MPEKAYHLSNELWVCFGGFSQYDIPENLPSEVFSKYLDQSVSKVEPNYPTYEAVFSTQDCFFQL